MRWQGSRSAREATAVLGKPLGWAGVLSSHRRSMQMIEIVEESWGYVVRSGQFQDSFRCKANALLAARMLATAEAVMGQHDVDVLLPMGHGEGVCLSVPAMV
jgi:hypothetical protein